MHNKRRTGNVTSRESDLGDYVERGRRYAHYTDEYLPSRRRRNDRGYAEYEYDYEEEEEAIEDDYENERSDYRYQRRRYEDEASRRRQHGDHSPPTIDRQYYESFSDVDFDFLEMDRHRNNDDDINESTESLRQRRSASSKRSIQIVDNDDDDDDYYSDEDYQEYVTGRPRSPGSALEESMQIAESLNPIRDNLTIIHTRLESLKRERRRLEDARRIALAKQQSKTPQSNRLEETHKKRMSSQQRQNPKPHLDKSLSPIHNSPTANVQQRKAKISAKETETNREQSLASDTEEEHVETEQVGGLKKPGATTEETTEASAQDNEGSERQQQNDTENSSRDDDNNPAVDALRTDPTERTESKNNSMKTANTDEQQQQQRQQQQQQQQQQKQQRTAAEVETNTSNGSSKDISSLINENGAVAATLSASTSTMPLSAFLHQQNIMQQNYKLISQQHEQIQQLKEQIRILQLNVDMRASEAADHEAQLRDLENDNNTLHDIVDLQIEKIRTLEKERGLQREVYEKKIKELVDSESMLKQDVVQAGEKLQARDAVIKEHEDIVTKLKSELSELQSQIHCTQDRHREELQTANEQLKKRESELQSLRKDYSALENQSRQLQEEIQLLQNEKAEAETEYKEMLSELENRYTEMVKKLADSVVAGEDQIRQLEEHLFDLKTKYEKEKEEVIVHTTKELELRKELNEARQKIKEQYRELELLKEGQNAQSAALEDVYQQKIKEITAREKTAKQAHREAQQRNEELETENRTLRKEKTESDALLQTTKKELDKEIEMCLQIERDFAKAKQLLESEIKLRMQLTERCKQYRETEAHASEVISTQNQPVDEETLNDNVTESQLLQSRNATAEPPPLNFDTSTSDEGSTTEHRVLYEHTQHDIDSYTHQEEDVIGGSEALSPEKVEQFATNGYEKEKDAESSDNNESQEHNLREDDEAEPSCDRPATAPPMSEPMESKWATVRPVSGDCDENIYSETIVERNQLQRQQSNEVFATETATTDTRKARTTAIGLTVPLTTYTSKLKHLHAKYELQVQDYKGKMKSLLKELSKNDKELVTIRNAVKTFRAEIKSSAQEGIQTASSSSSVSSISDSGKPCGRKSPSSNRRQSGDEKLRATHRSTVAESNSVGSDSDEQHWFELLTAKEKPVDEGHDEMSAGRNERSAERKQLGGRSNAVMSEIRPPTSPTIGNSLSPAATRVLGSVEQMNSAMQTPPPMGTRTPQTDDYKQHIAMSLSGNDVEDSDECEPKKKTRSTTSTSAALLAEQEAILQSILSNPTRMNGGNTSVQRPPPEPSEHATATTGRESKSGVRRSRSASPASKQHKRLRSNSCTGTDGLDLALKPSKQHQQQRTSSATTAAKQESYHSLTTNPQYRRLLANQKLK